MVQPSLTGFRSGMESGMNAAAFGLVMAAK